MKMGQGALSRSGFDGMANSIGSLRTPWKRRPPAVVYTRPIVPALIGPGLAVSDRAPSAPIGQPDWSQPRSTRELPYNGASRKSADLGAEHPGDLSTRPPRPSCIKLHARQAPQRTAPKPTASGTQHASPQPDTGIPAYGNQPRHMMQANQIKLPLPHPHGGRTSSHHLPGWPLVEATFLPGWEP